MEAMAPPLPDQDPNKTQEKRHQPPTKDKTANNKVDKDDLFDLNEGELKGLLEEAITYKNPKDRVGKSEIFNKLLNVAEEDERNARAARAGGSQLVRHCNQSAKRSSRHRKKQNSISENRMHGGSLDNLAQAEQKETSKARTKKSVSARQREGGSLPACNVNSISYNTHNQFLDEARRKRDFICKSKENSLETEYLLEHDDLAKDYQTNSQSPIEMVQFQSSNQGNRLFSSSLNHTEDGNELLTRNVIDLSTVCRTPNTNLTRLITNSNEFEKKFDENANLHNLQTKLKKKKAPLDRKVVVCESDKIPGHRSDIINDMDKLVSFIENDSKTKQQTSKSSSSASGNKKKKDGGHGGGGSGEKKQRLKKCNSLSEISTKTNLDDFNEVKINQDDILDEKRRSWGQVETPLFVYNSMENLDSNGEFCVVMKKKKSRKRRNSIGTKQAIVSQPKQKTNLNDLRRKSTSCSMPHSEKSNYSSDDDSVHSLPIDGGGGGGGIGGNCETLNGKNFTYADMAKTDDFYKRKQNVTSCVTYVTPVTSDCFSKIGGNNCNEPPDVHNIRNFPAINQIGVKEVKNVGGGKIGKNKKHELMVMEDQYCNNQLPLDIPDVQTIEKMQLIASQQQSDILLKKSLGQKSNCDNISEKCSSSSSSNNSNISNNNLSMRNNLNNNNNNTNNNNNNNNTNINNNNNITNNNNNSNRPPPVVILSGNGSSKEIVPGLVFGFDINEQLLNDENDEVFNCNEFIARFKPPPTITTLYNHDKIVNFIGTAWDDAVVNLKNGSVQYYFN